MKKIPQVTIVLSVGLLLLMGCSGPQKNESKANQVTTSSTKTTTNKQQTSTQTSSPSSDQKLVDSDVQQIGTDEVGYVYVSADWLPFTDLAGGDSYQYSATDAYTIITMSSYDKETLGVAQIDDAAAKQAANSYAYIMDESGNFGPLTGAKAQIADYEAYQLYANAKSDGKFICTWVFVTEAKDKVYLVSLEGKKDSEEFLKAFSYIEESWSAKKE